MTRARPIHLILGALTAAVLGSGLLVAPAEAADDAGAQGLTVELTSLSPATIPTHGPLTIDGIIRNTGDETWTQVNVYPLTSTRPMTTRDEVDAAAQSDPATTEIGDRLLDAGTTVGDIPAGGSTTFHLRVPRAMLKIGARRAGTHRYTGDPGVYWIGVHVLGASSEGRDSVADGRARTFIPLVAGKVHARVSLVVPVRRGLRYGTDGRLRNADKVARDLAPEGRLGRIAALAQQAGALPLTWLVDPAVLDAAEVVAADNPPLDLAKASQRPSPSPSPTDTPSAGANGDAAPTLTDADRKNATQWLDTITSLTRNGETLALPYADPDVAAVARTAPALLGRARSMASSAFAARHIPVSPAVAPPDGYLDPKLIDHLADDATAVLADHGHQSGATARTSQGRRFVYADSQTDSGGPRPAPRVEALPLRQRILADAAVDALGHSKRTQVVTLPDDWDPGIDWQQAGFFEGLDQTWLTLVPLPSGVPGRTPTDSYPGAVRRAEVPAASIVTARHLARTGAMLGRLLDDGTAARDLLDGAALAGVSYAARKAPVVTRIRVHNLDDAVQTLLESVKVVGTDFVTLSGGSGILTVSMVNGLDKPITVGLRAHTDSPKIRIDDPDAVKLAAGQRSTVRLHAHAGAIGVHVVRLTPVTTKGVALGTPLVFNLRTSQVGRVFWGVLIACGVVLLVLIMRRVQQRLRSDRWRQ